MIPRIIEIAEERRHLSLYRGFLIVEAGGSELGRVPLDDIGAIIGTGHGLTWSSNLIVALAERGALLVICAANFLPAAWLWPAIGHHRQASRMRAQLEAGKPLHKRLWQQVIKAKIANQSALLEQVGRGSGGLRLLQAKVQSGDSDNIEAQAARRYWPLLFGEDFRRDRDAGGINTLLNYGYTILRSATARAIMGRGLHPSLGLQHRNEDFCLIDDLMEPFRPLVDLTVMRLIGSGITEVIPEAKKELASIIGYDLRTERGRTPLATCLERLAFSLAKSFEEGKPLLDLPLAPLPLEFDSVPALR